MDTFLKTMVFLLMAAVVVVLIRGLMNMAKGGSPVTSNKLMQARVILQFFAIVFILLFVFLARR